MMTYDEGMVDTADGTNTNEDERFDNEAVIEGNMMALAEILLIFLQTLFANRCFVASYTIWECDSTINSNNNNINNGTNSICDSCECTINVTQDTDYNSLSNAHLE